MDRLEAMSVLLAVVEAGNLSAASRKLGMPLATVSRNISELETHLKSRILIRSTRQMQLTDAGRAYVEACKRILEEVDEAERAASGEYSAPRGDLTVTAPILFGRLHVLPLALEFLHAYPDINLTIDFSDRTVNLLEGNIDCALRIGELADSSLVATRIGAIRRVTCASPAYLERRGRPRQPADLVAHDCITFTNLSASQGWRFEGADEDGQVLIRSRLTVNTAEAAIDAASAGLGVTRVLSYQIADALKAGTLEIILQDFEPTPWPVNLLYPGRGLQPQKLRAFLDYVTPRLRARLA